MNPQPKPKDRRYQCGMCSGRGTVLAPKPKDRRNEKTCPQCRGRGEL